MSQPVNPLELRKYSHSQWILTRGSTPAEIPLTLTINGNEWLVFMCTPEHIEALGVGFLSNEGLIESMADIAQVRTCPSKDNVDIWTTKKIEKPNQWRKTSGCTGGVTAVGSEIKAHPQGVPPPPPMMSEARYEVMLSPQQVNDLVIKLFAIQAIHRQSGGIHASALSDGTRLFLSCEDIGRHNTLDKLAGRVLLENILEPRCIVLTTGRISSEMLQKSASMGTAVVISCTAVTSQAVSMAEAWGLTLIGYAKKERFTIFTHPRRIRP